jgi:hypothetical protein
MENSIEILKEEVLESFPAYEAPHIEVLEVKVERGFGDSLSKTDGPYADEDDYTW